MHNRLIKKYVHYKKCENKNSGLTKRRKSYVSGVDIVGSLTEGQQQAYGPKLSAASSGRKSLEPSLQFDKYNKCVNAFDVLTHPLMLHASYRRIKSKPGNMTSGTDKITFDGIESQHFLEIHNKLLNESWQPKPSKRIYIKKANGTFRPLGISSPRDKIVQDSFRAVLAVVLEPKFLDVSTGFRENRGCHDALEQIRYWNGVKWFIEGDINNFFDEIDHHILEKLLINHFNDQRFIDLYWKFVRAGYVEFDKNNVSEIGIPQGSIVSPILSNLYLHELDKFIINEKELLSKSNMNISLRNPIYNKLDNRIQHINRRERNLLKKGVSLPIEVKNEQLELIKLRRKTNSTVPNTNTAKIYYVRYADDWIIGVLGSFTFAKFLKLKISIFLKTVLKLKLNVEKTLITDVSKRKPASFLGTNISKILAVKSEIKNFKNKRGHMQRISQTATLLKAPISKLLDKLIEKGLAKKQINRFGVVIVVGESRAGWQNLPAKKLVIRFKAILNAILNYYSFVDNKSRLNTLYWILLSGLAKTIAQKFRMKSMKRVFKKYGKDLSKLPDGVGFPCPKLNHTPKNFHTKYFKEFPILTGYFKWRVRSLAAFGSNCSACGSAKNIQMHHIKHIKTINTHLKGIDKEMAAINRKQVPLCIDCHLKVHSGKYDGISLKNLADEYKIEKK